MSDKPPVFVQLRYVEEKTGDTAVFLDMRDGVDIKTAAICYIDSKLVDDTKARRVFKDAMAEIIERFLKKNRSVLRHIHPFADQELRFV